MLEEISLEHFNCYYDLMSNSYEAFTKLTRKEYKSLKKDLAVKMRIIFYPEETQFLILIEDITDFEKVSLLK